MSEEEKLVLNELLDRYERSKWFREGYSKQRVLMKASEVPEIHAMEENADAWRSLLQGLARLKQYGLLDYSWVRFEKDHLVDEIWLCTAPEAVEKAYEAAGRTPKAAVLVQLRQQLSDALPSFRQDSDLFRFLTECMETIDTKHRMPRFFSEYIRLTEEILRFLAVLENLAAENSAVEHSSFEKVRNPGIPGTDGEARQELMERVLSTRLYGDSKYFERFVKSKVLSILRYLDTEELGDDQLLLQRGVTRWPQIFEFTGPVELQLENGDLISFAALTDGAYINSETLRHVRRVSLIPVGGNPVRRILFIENKANYVDYVMRKRSKDELVVYHGGVFSPAAGQWFSLLAQAKERCCPDAACFHWSDIDLGGFRIFVRLRDTYFPDVQPWQMDVETLHANLKSCMSIKDRSYGGKLEKLLKDPGYQIFHPVIRCMLRENVRLEQETLVGSDPITKLLNVDKYDKEEEREGV